jgi:hypothetical protein
VEQQENKFDIVHSTKIPAGKRRTYFIDVRKTKGADYFISITESTKRFDGKGIEKHKIFLYKEDFTRFVEKLNESVNYIKTDLMPDYDFDLYARKQEEWENRMNQENAKSSEDSGEGEDMHW